MNIIEVLKNRYSTKEFDPSKKLTQDDIEKLKHILSLPASSTNIQPWHFIIVTSDEGKGKLKKSVQGLYSFNEDKIVNSSAVVVFSSLVDLTEEYLMHLLEKEDKDGRFAQKEFKEKNHQGRSMFAKMHKYDYKDFTQWCTHQVYLNLGNFLLATAVSGYDTLAMEGVDMKVIDEEFDLREKGYTVSVVVAVGYHKNTDFNKALPKSRLSMDETIEVL